MWMNKTATSSSKNELLAPKKKPAQQQSAAPTFKMLTVILHVEKPDIILLEDIDDINSNCIEYRIVAENTYYGRAPGDLGFH